MTMGTNRMVLGHEHWGGGEADGRRAEWEMADAEEENAMREARDVMMTEAEFTTTTVTESATESGALATQD
jgi:hypothetical protein